MSTILSRLGWSSTSIIEIDDTPPPFPALNSIQRIKPTITTTAPPPPLFSFDSPPPSPGINISSSPQISIESDLLVTPTTTTKKKRVKVNIGVGYSQLDWARLKSSGVDLRGGVQQLRRITPSELASHNTQEDCWQSYNGKVYNITNFLLYHPGGPKELMRAAGRDGTELHMKTHAWISIDQMMEGCLVGFMVREE